MMKMLKSLRQEVMMKIAGWSISTVLRRKDSSWVQVIYTVSSGIWTQVSLSIQTTRVIQVLPICHLKMAKVQYNLSQESKDSTPRAAQNSWELITFQSWLCGPNYPWKNKVMELRGAYCNNKRTRALFYSLKRMARRAPIREPEHWISTTSFLQTHRQEKDKKGNGIIEYCLIILDMDVDSHTSKPFYKLRSFRKFCDAILGCWVTWE